MSGPPLLVVMAGLPGTGKSTIAREVARALPAMLLAVDTIEASFVRAGLPQDERTGLGAYLAAAALAEEQLCGARSVVVDAVNAVAAAREQWHALAERQGTRRVVIEVVCGDEGQHRARLQGRRRGLELREPGWQDVVDRRTRYEPWDEPRAVIDTTRPLAECVRAALAHARG